MRKLLTLLAILALTTPLVFYGCLSGDTGPAGATGSTGTSAPTTGTISGTVTDATKGDALSGVTVTATDRATGGAVLATATTDASGQYSLTAPLGGCYVNFSRTYYTQPGGMYVGVGGGLTTTLNATMAEAASGAPSVAFAAEAGDDYGYGQTVVIAASANLSVSDPNDTTLTYAWSNTTSPRQADYTYLGTVTGTGAAGSITFPSMAQAFATRLARNAAGAAGVTGGSDVSGYTIPARFGILPIFPDTRGAIGARVTVSDGRGKSTQASITLNAATILPGVRTVPVNSRVYLNRGNDNASQTWTLTLPAGSAAVLDNAASRTPSFKADVAGTYTAAAGGNTMTIYAGTYAGVITAGSGNTFTADPNCTVCHNATLAPDMFTPWKLTNHATLFTRNINISVALGGDAEGRSCMACHTVGYDPGAANGGFDDAMYAYDNVWLPWGGYITPDPNNWANMFTIPGKAAMAKLANIQCENCHGPNTGAGHMSTSGGSLLGTPVPFTSARISYSAEVCAQCHGRTSHNFYSQWATPSAAGAGHSNRQLAIDEGTSSSCGRCHGAQGFTKYVDKLIAGSFTLASSDLTGAGLTTANVEPITCTACHDPHQATVLDGYKTRPNGDGTYIYKQITNNQLRVYNNTGLLPAGFRVSGFGKGALCVTCHNSRNGAQTSSSTRTYLHEDDTPASNGGSYNSGNPTSFSAPHTAAQGDVVAGRNAWFMGTSLPMISRHASIENTCVECHMALNPVKKGARDAATGLLAGVSKSHLFRLAFTEDLTKPETQIVNFCTNCHGEETVNGEGLQASVENGLELLAAKMVASLRAKLTATSVAAPIYMTIYPTDAAGAILLNASGGEVQSDNAAFIYDNTNVATAISVVEPHGQIGFFVTLTNPATITVSGVNYTFSKFEVQLGKIFTVYTPGATTPVDNNNVYKLNGNMVRAGWNYFLIEGDGSKGIHNPAFAQQVLNATVAKDLGN